MLASTAVEQIQRLIESHGDMKIKVFIQTGPDSYKYVEVTSFTREKLAGKSQVMAVNHPFS